MKLKKVEIEFVEYYFVESENNHWYRRPKNSTKNDWEFFKDGEWIKFENGNNIEKALLKYSKKNENKI